MKDAHDIIKRPVVTERSMAGTADRKYTFEVSSDAGKIEIRKAAEELFGVKVESVHTVSMPKKKKRLGVHLGSVSGWKKAIIKLTEDSKSIEFFDSLM